MEVYYLINGLKLPFRHSRIKIQYLSLFDTSIVSLAESKAFKSVLNQPFEFLNEGFTVENISSKISYVEQPSHENFRKLKEMRFTKC